MRSGARITFIQHPYALTFKIASNIGLGRIRNADVPCGVRQVRQHITHSLDSEALPNSPFSFTLRP